MTLLDTLNVGGTEYGVQSSLPMGTCATPAGTEVKAAVFADNFELSAGNLIAVTFTYANTYGNGSTTYPKLTVNDTNYPIVFPTGEYAGSGAWANGQVITFMYDGTNLIMTSVPKIQTTDQVTSGSALPVTSGGAYNALQNKTNMFTVSSPNGTTKYVMIKSTAIGFNGILCNRYNGMVLLAGYSGTTYPNLLYPSSDYGIKGIKIFSALDGNTRKTHVLIKYADYAPIAFTQLDPSTAYTIDPDIAQTLYDDPTNNFSGVQDLAVYDKLSLVPRLSLPAAPTTDGAYNLKCTVADGVPTFSWT